MPDVPRLMDGPPEFVSAWNAMAEAVNAMNRLSVAPPLQMETIAGIKLLSVRAADQPVAMRLARVYSTISADSVGQVKFYTGTQGSEVADDDTTDVYSRFITVATDRWVYVADINGKPEIVYVIPFACQNMTVPSTLSGWDKTVDQQLTHTSGGTDGEACFVWENIEDCP